MFLGKKEVVILVWMRHDSSGIEVHLCSLSSIIGVLDSRVYPALAMAQRSPKREAIKVRATDIAPARCGVLYPTLRVIS